MTFGSGARSSRKTKKGHYGEADEIRPVTAAALAELESAMNLDQWREICADNEVWRGDRRK